jgi:RNA polymerase-binding transcription factor
LSLHISKGSGMNKSQATSHEKSLASKREQLLQSVSRTRQESQGGLDFGGDEADQATASQSKELTFLQQAHGQGLLNLVEAALTRIRDKTFGECLHCGEEISAKRLKAVPWSPYCITCQELIAEQK